MSPRMITGTALLAMSLLAGCDGGGTSAPQDGTTPSSEPTSPTAPSTTPTPDTTPPPSAGTCAQRILDKLSPEQRVGQLFMAGVQVDTGPASASATLGENHVGSILLIGQATDGTDAVAAVVEHATAVAGSPAGARPMVAVDQEGGRVQHLKGSGFPTMPSAEEQSRMPPSQLRRAARSWGADMRTAGVDLNLAPVSDVVPASIGDANQPVGALDRGYGSDPSAVGEHVTSFVAGMDRAGVATAVKHFPGLGKVRGNTDVASGVVDTLTTRDDPDLAPFRAGIEAGAQFLMVSLATYSHIDPDHRAVFSPAVIEEMVRRDLGFDGVIMSDDLGAATEVAGVPPARRALDFLQAGGDLVVTADPSTLPAMTRAVITRGRSDQAFRHAVDRRALRVLTAKQQMGQLTCPQTR